MEIAFTSRSMICHSWCVPSHNLLKNFSELLRLLTENYLHTHKKRQSGWFCSWQTSSKTLIKVIQQWRCLQKIWFLMHLRNYFQTMHLTPLQFFCLSNWFWSCNERLQFRRNSTHRCTKILQRESFCFLTPTFLVRQNSLVWNPVFTILVRILCLFNRDSTTHKIPLHLKSWEEPKKWDSPRKWRTRSFVL